MDGLKMISNYDIHFDEHLHLEGELTEQEREDEILRRADEYCDELGLFQ